MRSGVVALTMFLAACSGGGLTVPIDAERAQKCISEGGCTFISETEMKALASGAFEIGRTAGQMTCMKGRDL
jgi:hypothetical protein